MALASMPRGSLEPAEPVRNSSVPATERIDIKRHHVPALDGLRAVAVVAVIAYHLGFGWAGGGYLGVDLFFVLSGFLITTLLVEERTETGTLNLPGFWLRRARRLFPALVVVLGAIALYAALDPARQDISNLSGDVLSTMFYVANWHFIAAHSSYFARFASPSPLEHTWSLAIEEQFYLVWPLLLLMFAKVGGRQWRRVATFGTAALTVASVLAMGFLASGAHDVSRAYFGTDTRAFELMIGALLAFWIDRYALSGVPGSVVDWAAAAAIGLFIAACVLLSGPPHWLFQGGLLVIAFLVAIVIASACRPGRGPLRTLLSLRPVRFIGRISYGLYLWHWPVIVYITSSTTGLPGWAVDVVRVAVMVASSTISYYLVELPIRRGRVGTLRVSVAVTPVATGAVAIALFFSPFVVPPPPASAATAPPATPTTGLLFPLASTPTQAHPLRVLIIGDSLMTVAATGLEAALDATGVVKVDSVAKPAWGLTAPRWRQYLRRGIARDKPDVVMGTFGIDASVVAEDPKGYRRLMDDAVSIILSPHTRVQGVVFLQYPDVAPWGWTAAQIARNNNALHTWNAIAQSEALQHSKSVGYLPVARWLQWKGQFAVWLPNARGRFVRARALDNYHLCPAGTARYASATVDALRTTWPVPPPAGPWWSGSWTIPTTRDRP